MLIREHVSLVYTFNTGHATLIGQSTKKCIAYAVKSKRYRICQNANTKEVPARKRTCPHNWSASAKSMEPDVACEMLQGLMDEEKQVNIQLMWHGWSYYIHKTHTKQDKNCVHKCTRQIVPWWYTHVLNKVWLLIDFKTNFNKYSKRSTFGYGLHYNCAGKGDSGPLH